MLPEIHDLVVCLETGEVGVVIGTVTENWYRVSFPSGVQVVEPEDIEVLQSGREKRRFVDLCERQ